MNLTRVAAALLLAGLAGCSHPPTPSAGPATTAPAATRSTAPSSTDSVVTIPAAVSPAAIVVPGGKASWLAGLPDLRTTDWSDPDQVMQDFTVASLTWDTTTDKTSAYADQRASLWATASQQAAQARYDADTAVGQSDFLAAAAHQAHTTTTILAVTSEGQDPTAGGAVRRIVRYRVATIPRDTATTTTSTGRAWLTVIRENGQWRVQTALIRADQN